MRILWRIVDKVVDRDQGAEPSAHSHPEDQGPMPDPADARPDAFVLGAAYGMLGVLGAVLGLVGSFSYPWTFGSLPIAALLLVGVNLGALLLAGRGMGGKLGALVPAVTWLLVVTILQGRRTEGDLVITATGPGYLFMLGGTLVALLAIMLTPSSRPAGEWLTGRARE